MPRIRTKIICTIGPAVDTKEKIIELIKAGMNVARLNFSHGTHEKHEQVINLLKQARQELGMPIAIMLDTKGPEIRLSSVKGGAIQVRPNQCLHISSNPDPSDENQITINPFSVLETVQNGMKILFDDGYIISTVVQKNDFEVVVEVKNHGVLKSNKGVNIPNVDLNLPAMTQKDIDDLTFGCEQGVDIIAASFIRSSEHVLEIKELLHKLNRSDLLVIAKIENSQGVENFDSILQASDGIMIARGDLGVELDLGLVPRLQKMMIKKCYHASKLVVTATQMLESMILNPRPTRAEVSDVANAIYDSSSAVMLSGETAIGNYPIDSVTQMKSIAISTEGDFNFKEFFKELAYREYHDISSSVALAAVKTAYSANAKAIFVYTSSGFTAKLVSRLRPCMPIFALTQNKHIYNQLAVIWGVVPIYVESFKNKQEAFSFVKKFALKNKFLNFGDLVVVTAGSPFGKIGSTNMMIVESIGDILVRGQVGLGHKVKGRVKIILSPGGYSSLDTENKLVIIPRCDSSFFNLLKCAKGIILQNSSNDTISEKYALLISKTFDIPTITRADSALDALKDNEAVTLDPKSGLIYRGDPSIEA